MTFIGVQWDIGLSMGPRPRFHLRVAWGVVASLWLFVTILIAGPAGKHKKESSNPYWLPTPVRNMFFIYDYGFELGMIGVVQHW